MRVLAATQPAISHFHLLAPYVQALRAAGHMVAVATAPSFASRLASLGIAHLAAGHDWLESAPEEAFPELAALPADAWGDWLFTHVFLGDGLRAFAADLIAAGESWRPDVVFYEANALAAPLAAAALSLPAAKLCYAHFPSPARQRRWLEPAFSAVARQLAIDVDTQRASADCDLAFASIPPSLLLPDDELAPALHFIRHTPYTGTADALPGWIARLDGRPTVLVSLGTIFNRQPELFQAILEGLRDLPSDSMLNVIVTVGHNLDPAAFGPQPSHIHIERYVPHEALFPRCAAVISHGGLNTVLAALGHGLPLVLLPLAADQPENARRCQAAGVARALAPIERTPEAMRAATQAVLREPGYRESARRAQAEMQEMPGMDHAVHLLERLAVERGPIAREPDRA